VLSGTPALVRDISPGPGSSFPYPDGQVAVGSTLFFSANDGSSGRELWKTDGTAGGTVRIKDIRPGAASSGPQSLVAVGGAVYFAADDGISGSELWKTDGTAAGTVRVRDIRAGATGSNPRSFTVAGSTVYFAANDGTSGEELWKTDGTAAGTVRVRDIQIGSAGSTPTDLTVAGSTLYFQAAGKLWKTDGTAAGTAIVADITPAGGGRPQFAAVGDTLYFVANDGISGVELWKTDGTADGTVLVKDIAEFRGGSYPGYLTAVGSTLFFAANNGSRFGNQLWKTDGTESGTVLIKDFPPQERAASPKSLTVVGSTLYFTADDGRDGRELWKTDGTVEGTVVVRDIRPGMVGSEPRFLAAVGSEVYFQANDGMTGSELWKSDGTATGTVRVNDIRRGAAGSVPYYLTVVGSTVYFEADDGVTGAELWRVRTADPPAAPVLALGRGVADGATGAEATQASGVVTARAPLGVTISVTLKGSAGQIVQTVGGRGAAVPVPIVLAATDAARLGNGRVTVTAIATSALGDRSPIATSGFTLDTVPPRVPSITLGAGVANGATRAEALQASGVITVAGELEGRIAITLNGVAGQVVRTLSGKGPAVLLPVVLTAADLTKLGPGAVAVAATASDAAGNSSTATLGRFTIDPVVPAVVAVAVPTPGSYRPGDLLTFAVRFAENVVVRGAPFINLTLDGNAVRRATYVSGSGSPEIVFRYGVQSGDRAAKGPTVARTIALGGGSIADAAGNAANLAIAPPSLAGVMIAG